MKRWLKITLTCIVFVGLTVALYLVGFKGDWIKPLVEGAGFWGYIFYVLIQIIVTTFMCFVPATTFTFTLLSVQIFNPLTGFILSAIGCFLSSMLMFTIGDKLGEHFVDWLIGKDSRIKAQNMVSDRATVLVPFMLAFPFFPDDAICMVSGMTKMKYWYFAIVSALCRTLGIAVTAFLGSNLIDYASFSVADWFLFISIVFLDIYTIWKLSGDVEKFLRSKRSKKAMKELTQINKDDEDKEDKHE